MPDSIELYQLVASAIRDVAQARFLADLYSRQISFQYEKDRLLRQFPVPRAEIEEAEISLFFTVLGVSVDPSRHTSRNAAISSLFDQFSAGVVREILDDLRGELDGARTNGGPANLDDFEHKVRSSTNLDRLAGRLLQYLNEEVEDVLDIVKQAPDPADQAATRPSRWARVEERVIEPFVLDQLSTDAELANFYGLSESVWKGAISRVRSQHAWRALLDKMADQVADLQNKYPDYKIVVGVDPQSLGAAADRVSSIKIKAVVKNYKWSKVDIDKGDLRNIRMLNPE